MHTFTRNQQVRVLPNATWGRGADAVDHTDRATGWTGTVNCDGPDSDGDLWIRANVNDSGWYVNVEFVEPIEDTVTQTSDEPLALDSTYGFPGYRLTLDHERTTIRLRADDGTDDLWRVPQPIREVHDVLLVAREGDDHTLVRARINAVVDLYRMQDEALTLERRVTEVRDAHRLDIETISDRLNEEADRRGWCDEFEDIVDEVNADLTYDLAKREKDWTISGTVQVMISVPVTTTVSASTKPDDSDAKEALENALENSTITNAVYDGWDVHDDCFHSLRIERA